MVLTTFLEIVLYLQCMAWCIIDHSLTECFFVAGIVNVLMTTPLWVVNTRLKLQGATFRTKDLDSSSKTRKYKGIIGEQYLQTPEWTIKTECCVIGLTKALTCIRQSYSAETNERNSSGVLLVYKWVPSPTCSYSKIDLQMTCRHNAVLLAQPGIITYRHNIIVYFHTFTNYNSLFCPLHCRWITTNQPRRRCTVPVEWYRPLSCSCW